MKQAALRLKRSRDEARLQRNLAEANLLEARQAVDDSFTKVSESVLPHTPGLQPLRKQLLEDSLRYYQGFVRRLADQHQGTGLPVSADARRRRFSAPTTCAKSAGVTTRDSTGRSAGRTKLRCPLEESHTVSVSAR